MFLLWPIRTLTLTDERGKIVFMKPVKLGETYAVRFIHSVARRPVKEVYEIAAGCSVLRESWFDMGGAGLQPDLSDPKLHMTVENDLYHVTGYDMKLPEVTYRVNMVVADHRLIIGDEEWPMKLWSGPGKPLTFRVERGSMAHVLWLKARTFYVKLMKGE